MLFRGVPNLNVAIVAIRQRVQQLTQFTDFSFILKVRIRRHSAMLTSERIERLKVGRDYIANPFSPGDLFVRVQAVLASPR